MGKSEVKFYLGGIEEVSTVDWPGKIVTLIFFGGCNLRCRYCQNSHILEQKEGMLTNISKVKEEILKNLALLDGILLTGGEPTLQEEALLELARWAKKKGLLVGLETNGTRPEVIEKMLGEGIVDFIALDVKAPLNDPELYKKMTGISEELLEKVKKSLNILRRSKVEHEIRTTIVPKLLKKEDLNKIYEEIGKNETWVWQKFKNSPYVLDKSLNEGFSEEDWREFTEASKNFENVILRFW